MPVRTQSSYSTPLVGDHFRPPFTIPSSSRDYDKQYANLYWLRLAVLRPKVAKRANLLWHHMKGVSAPPLHVKRVLDVECGKLCYVVGTVYMDMALKPNVLEDLAREHYIAAPPPRRKFCSENDEIMLEDESGRIRLVGERVSQGAGHFVTGTILGALGVETPSGDFEVLEICYAGLQPHPDLPKPEDEQGEGEWVALISGLEMGGADIKDDLKATLFAEWLVGDLGDKDEDANEAIKVTRLIIAGNSLSPAPAEAEASSKPKRYGYDSASYSALPTKSLDSFLTELLPSISIDLMPGETDPAGPTIPQQPLHRAMFPNACEFEDLFVRTNPFWCDVGTASFFGTSGQTLDDIFKYLSTEDRLSMAVQTLEWAHVAPTCPDTLWCYPFSDQDPFILLRSPHVYFIGNQPKFETKLVKSDDGHEKVRVILLPNFRDTGEVVLVNTKSLECQVRRFVV